MQKTQFEEFLFWNKNGKVSSTKLIPPAPPPPYTNRPIHSSTVSVCIFSTDNRSKICTLWLFWGMVGRYCSNQPTTLFYSQHVKLCISSTDNRSNYVSKKKNKCDQFLGNFRKIFREILLKSTNNTPLQSACAYLRPTLGYGSEILVKSTDNTLLESAEQIFDRQYDYSEDSDANQPTIGLQCRQWCKSTDHTILHWYYRIVLHADSLQ